VGLEKERLRSTHFEQALILMRKEDHHLDKQLREQAELIGKLRTELEDKQ
jgi:hypothetical protein